MNSESGLRAVSVIVAVGCLAFSGRASADVPPDPAILEMTAAQKEQDVVIDFAVVRDYWGNGQLARVSEAAGEDVVIAVTAEMSLVETRDSSWCAWVSDVSFPGHQAWCAENPESCSDCDGDGEVECRSCEPECHYSYRDRCVPPGLYTYSLSYSAGMSRQTVNIDVTDISGDICDTEAPSTDTGSVGDQDTGDALKENAVDAGAETETNREAADTDATEKADSGCIAAPAGNRKPLLPILFRLFL